MTNEDTYMSKLRKPVLILGYTFFIILNGGNYDGSY